MENVVSFVTANFIARQCGYHLEHGWDEGQQATEDYFRPVGTFARRFDALLAEIVDLGFSAVDVWTGHINWTWATPEHIAAARTCLQEHHLQLVSVAGYFGSAPDEFEAACRLAAGLQAPLLGGVAPVLASHRPAVLALLGRYGLKLAVENHREKTAEELLATIGDPEEGRIGAAVDTGSFATRGCDAAVAIATLAERVIHVHFRDVVPTGSDESVAFGEGCVPLPACVEALRRLHYTGAISVEHEPEQSDPRPDCRRSLEMLRSWLAR